jgi:hypothetical protein
MGNKNPHKIQIKLKPNGFIIQKGQNVICCEHEISNKKTPQTRSPNPQLKQALEKLLKKNKAQGKNH